ncbi:MAG: tRNA 4-thiouridine(8) synthase ThiI [Lachnospiraceae bacterium]|nr:tRNA 4-thiouridine(8) synthase ThiI [Lachnospiraceae bacterium]
MVFRTFLLKYGEIGIKGKNRGQFEDALVAQVRHALSRVDGEFEVSKEQGRIYVDVTGPDDCFDPDEVTQALQRVFGLVGICQVLKVPVAEPEVIAEEAVRYIDQTYDLTSPVTFKVHTRRANKQYPVTSMEVDALVGEKLLGAFEGKMSVDVHHPDMMVYIEIREEVYIYSKIVPGPGGMPVGTNGRAQLLLSGGIDSPVAGWMIAKRGVALDATYFHAPPYTSERAKQKVVDLARLVARYSGPIRLHVVNFTDIQLEIYDRCPHDELTIIMRRYMMKIAEAFAKKDGSMGLITGESIGQVASQTIQSLVCTDDAATMPVFRPLIGFDKQDIIDVSLKIGTYDTSIQPFEDCCTIFVAKHPVTKPRLDIIKKSEERLSDNIDALMQQAIDGAETITIS